MRKRNQAASLEDARKERMHPVPQNKLVSLDERAKDEQKSFLEQLLQEGARKLLQTAIENEVIDNIQFHQGSTGLRMDSGWWYAMDICRSERWESGVGPIPVRQPRVRHRTRVVFPVRFCPSICARFPASML